MTNNLLGACSGVESATYGGSRSFGKGGRRAYTSSENTVTFGCVEDNPGVAVGEVAQHELGFHSACKGTGGRDTTCRPTTDPSNFSGNESFEILTWAMTTDYSERVEVWTAKYDTLRALFAGFAR